MRPSYNQIVVQSGRENELFDYSCWFDADQNGLVCMVCVNT